MEKKIVSYNTQSGIIIDCTEIEESEHKAARQEAEDLSFSFETIDSNSFRAFNAEPREKTLAALEEVGYSF